MGGFLSGRTSLTTVQTADIANDAITLAKLAAGTDGNIISFDASGDPVAIVTGNDGQVLHSAGAGAQPAFETLSVGKIGQVVTALSASTSTNSTAIPEDDTLPQNDEGDEILTLAITPANSSSKLIIFVTIAAWYNSTSGRYKVAALFKDSDASAIFAIADTNASTNTNANSFHWTQTAGSTSEQTFKLRVGSDIGNVVVNYASIHGGASQVVMSIWEVLP